MKTKLTVAILTGLLMASVSVVPARAQNLTTFSFDIVWLQGSLSGTQSWGSVQYDLDQIAMTGEDALLGDEFSLQLMFGSLALNETHDIDHAPGVFPKLFFMDGNLVEINFLADVSQTHRIFLTQIGDGTTRGAKYGPAAGTFLDSESFGNIVMRDYSPPQPPSRVPDAGSTAVLLGLGLCGLAVLRRHRKA